MNSDSINHEQMLCCIGMTNSSNVSYQKSCPLVHPNLFSSQEEYVAVTTVSTLEDLMRAKMAYRDHCEKDAFDESSWNELQFFQSDDAFLLHCRPKTAGNMFDEQDDDGESNASIFGIEDSDAIVCVSLLEPSPESIINAENNDIMRDSCSCQYLKGKWRRKTIECKPQCLVSPREHSSNASTIPFNCLRIIDLTTMQNNRRRKGTLHGFYPCFDTPGKVFHLIRSLLMCQSGPHCASPWKCAYHRNASNKPNTIDSQTENHALDNVVSIVVKCPQQFNDNLDEDNVSYWNDIEERELNELLKFRTGDAAPCYFLYSTLRMMGTTLHQGLYASPLTDLVHQLNSREHFSAQSDHVSSSDVMVLVFRHLPPRDILTFNKPNNVEYSSTPEAVNYDNYMGCLWESFVELGPETNLDKKNLGVTKYRMVSPPYLSFEQEYPGLFDLLLDSIQSVTEEAESIPLWTAWPERNHYAISPANEDDDTLPASWTVFPLCHTFPGNDVQQRKFIEKTCSFVPKTTELLKGIGSALRTALFSRLKGRTTLSTHVGWSDLANHVLRVHIPLIVPPGGLCGTWVDGCVETHEAGRVLIFDDSKCHRAFNYSNDERIVLIMDLERPTTLPNGTATGGHTDELDKFIKELS